MPARCPAVALLVLALAAGCDRSPVDGLASRFASFESRCDALPATSVEVDVALAPAREDRSLTHAELAAMNAPASPRHSTVGLTRASFGYRSTLELDGLEDARGRRACARPRVRVEVSAAPMTVYVAREFVGDGCREPLILEHEQRHVQVFADFAVEAAPALARRLEATLGRRASVGATMVELQASTKASLEAELDRFLAEAREELARRHAAIDTPDEYERLARECGPPR